jgi:hypothetical protein
MKLKKKLVKDKKKPNLNWANIQNQWSRSWEYDYRVEK